MMTSRVRKSPTNPNINASNGRRRKKKKKKESKNRDSVRRFRKRGKSTREIRDAQRAQCSPRLETIPRVTTMHIRGEGKKKNESEETETASGGLPQTRQIHTSSEASHCAQEVDWCNEFFKTLHVVHVSQFHLEDWNMISPKTRIRSTTPYRLTSS